MLETQRAFTKAVGLAIDANMACRSEVACRMGFEWLTSGGHHRLPTPLAMSGSAHPAH